MADREQMKRASGSHEEYSYKSQLLSEVLDDIGLNEERVNAKREVFLVLEESLQNVFNMYLPPGIIPALYYFGSQSEGTTINGLKSDLDVLHEFDDPTVIEDIKFWRPGRIQLLMLRHKHVTPGYCLLQLMSSDIPQPETNLEAVHNKIEEIWHISTESFKEKNGVILMNNKTLISSLLPQSILNGPALTWMGIPTISEMDCVFALKCNQWPKGARVPADEQNPQKWPTMDMKKEAESTGCLLVAVAGKDTHYEDFEWRISTSKAERILMFSLNQTQINCLVLLKIVLKTFIYPKYGKVLTSYMCKNILFHQIKKEHQDLWQAHTLLRCLKTCIKELQDCVMHKCLPHFIMPHSNLLEGKLTDEVQTQVLQEFSNIIEMDTDILKNIEIGDMGQRFGVKVNQNSTSLTLPTSGDVSNQDKHLTHRLTHTKTNS